MRLFKIFRGTMSKATMDRVMHFGMVGMRTERSYEIAVCRPLKLVATGETPADCPIVVLLDSSLTFFTAIERTSFYSAMGALQSAVLVGIGYPDGALESAITRTFDFTPTTPTGTHAELTPLIGTDFGGADCFLEFILEQLVPRIREMVPEASSNRVILHGFSLGGMFSAYALLKRPDAFETVSVISPSLWWNDFAILKELPTFSQGIAASGRCPRILVGVGALEQPPEDNSALADLGEDMRALGRMARMVDAARDFSSALEECGATDVQFVTFNEEDHSGALTAGTGRAMGFALKR